MNELSAACGTGQKRVIIGSDHPLYDSVVSAALMAKATQVPVEIWHLDTCNIRYNGWDFALLRVL